MVTQYLQDIPVGQASHFADIRPGEGKTIEIDSEKLAVYRDQQNKLHICSAVCTHMKCIVNWNNAEKTWDCPCHGSRFMIDGSVIEGPAILGLAHKQVDVQHEHLIQGDAPASGEPDINNPIT